MGNGDYGGGYGKPPKRYQFKKGEPSANPKGRPKGSKNIDPFARIMDRKITVIIDGKRRRITIEDAINEGMVRRALKGDPVAFALVFKARIAFARAFAQAPPTKEELIRQMAEEKDREQISASLRTFLSEALDRESARTKPNRPKAIVAKNADAG